MDCVNSALLATLTFHNIYCYHINVELGGPRCPGKCFNKFSPKWEFDHMTIRQARWPATEPTMWQPALSRQGGQTLSRQGGKLCHRTGMAPPCKCGWRFIECSGAFASRNRNVFQNQYRIVILMSIGLNINVYCTAIK